MRSGAPGFQVGQGMEVQVSFLRDLKAGIQFAPHDSDFGCCCAEAQGRAETYPRSPYPQSALRRRLRPTQRPSLRRRRSSLAAAGGTLNMGHALISVSRGLADQGRPQVVNWENLLFPLNERLDVPFPKRLLPLWAWS